MGEWEWKIQNRSNVAGYIALCLFNTKLEQCRHNTNNEWLKWYALTGELSQARLEGPKPEGPTAWMNSWVGTMSPSPPARGSGVRCLKFLSTTHCSPVIVFLSPGMTIFGQVGL